MAKELTSLQKFKLNIIREFIGWNTNDEIDSKTRELLDENAINFVENEDSGFPLISEDELNDLKALYNYVDEESDLAKAMLKMLVLIQDL